MPTLSPYQSEFKSNARAAWAAGARNVLGVLPTGGGKTVTFADIIHDEPGAVCAIAHRQELVSQISLALARSEVRHRIIGPESVVRLCINLHMAELGRSYFDPAARCAVAGVDTLVRRGGHLEAWARTVTLVVQDEAHHVLTSNKWGIAAAMFPNARGLYVTATPTRADGNGLGRHADGVIDAMIVGPSMRDLINAGYLTDYRIFAPPVTVDLAAVPIGASGDYVQKQLTTTMRASPIVGDVVDHYRKFTPGKRGVTFASDVETAGKMAARFNAANVPAAMVHADTPDAERIAAVRRLRSGQLLMLVNVDLFGEGFDLPAIEVVLMARPTCSYALFIQQFGRALRLLVDVPRAQWDTFTDAERRARIAASVKPRGVIIDAVGNVTRHGLPDARREWTLDRRERRSAGPADDVIPLWTCPACLAVVERVYKACTECDAERPAPSARNAPEMVDGDLVELDAETLAAMRGDVARVDMDPEAYRLQLSQQRVPLIGQLANVKRHAERQAAQSVLRDRIAMWAGWQRHAGRPDSESYRRFYFAFGVDVLTAQTLGVSEAMQLAARVAAHTERAAV